jgi:hypothetical protein
MTGRARITRLSGWITKQLPSSTAPSTFKGLPDDQDFWVCQDWIDYYQNNKALLGAAKARSFVLRDMERTAYYSTYSTKCAFDCDFKKFFAAEGIPIGNLASDSFCGIVEIGTNVGGGAIGLSEGVKGAGETVGNFGNFINKLTENPLLFGGIVLGVGYLGYKFVFPYAKKRL